MRNRHLLGLSVGLMAAAAMTAPPAVAQERRRVITINHEPLPSDPYLRPSPTPKRGKPTKAEKKAAKRARTRGVTLAPAPTADSFDGITGRPYAAGVTVDRHQTFSQHTPMKDQDRG